MSDGQPRTSFAKMLRDIDDADLDVYEFRLWAHIWRVGVSWESIRTMAKKCRMSVGRASQAKKSLLDRNFLAYEERNGRLGLAAVMCSSGEQIQQLDRSPDEQRVQEMNDYNNEDVVVVHHVNGNVHHMNTSVHHMNAILSMPNEDSLMKEKGDRASGRPVPPPIVIQPADRTPGRNGYHAPPEPEAPPPDTRRLAVAEMANAITDVTGVSARLNWDKVGVLAEELVEAGYSADQVRRHYSRQPVAGAWHWFDQDWRGKKGEPPTPKSIRETIAGATQQAAAPVKRLSQIERALAMFGNSPNPATQG